MDIKTLPFNIEVLQLNKDTLKSLKPVTVLDIMDGKTNSFNPNGLFSVEIFGKVGEEKRNTTFSYIHLKTKIIHPTIYRIITEILTISKDLMSAKGYAIFDPKTKQFEKTSPSEGQTGYEFFLSNLDKVDFNREGSELIQRKIRVLQKSIKENKWYIEDLLVMPAGLRDYEIDKYGKPTENEINLYYRKILALTHLITKADPYSPNLNTTRFKMQLAVMEVYEYLESLLKGRGKLIIGKWASRQIFNGTRNVITSLQNNTSELDSPRLIGVNSTVVGLYEFMKSTIPLAMYNIRNGFLLNVMPGPTSNFFMTNKKTLTKEMVPHNNSLYDQWMTNEGLEKTITRFGEVPLRQMVLDTDDHYLYLVYKDKDHYLLLQDINDLPSHLDKSLVSPITFVEVMYLNVYKYSKDIPGFVTRYPVLGTGGIYPSMCYVKTTINSTMKKELDSLGNETGNIALEYPTSENKFMDSVSPSLTHIKRLGADFDGDTVSFNTVYSEQAIKEVKEYLKSKRYYLDSSGKLTYSMSTDTIDFVVSNLTGD